MAINRNLENAGDALTTTYSDLQEAATNLNACIIQLDHVGHNMIAYLASDTDLDRVRRKVALHISNGAMGTQEDLEMALDLVQQSMKNLAMNIESLNKLA